MTNGTEELEQGWYLTLDADPCRPGKANDYPITVGWVYPQFREKAPHRDKVRADCVIGRVTWSGYGKHETAAVIDLERRVKEAYPHLWVIHHIDRPKDDGPCPHCGK